MAAITQKKQPGLIVKLLKPYFKETTLIIGGIIILLYIALSVLAPWITPYDPSDPVQAGALQTSSGDHILGTDELGRDLFTRILYGARVDLIIALCGVLGAYLLALPFGLSAGYFGGKVDRWISTLSESILTFPSLVLAIIIVSIIGTGTTGLVITIMITQAPQLVRYIRGFVFQVREMEFIEAGRASGSSHFYILRRHVLRNTLGSTAVVLSLLASEAVLVAAALGFLGLGVQPPDPELGTMLSRSRSYFSDSPHLMLYPGMAIAILILGFNLLGDGLRDLLDSKKK